MEEKTKCPMCGDLHSNCFVEKTEIEGKPFESYKNVFISAKWSFFNDGL